MNEIHKAIGGKHIDVVRMIEGEMVHEQVFVKELSIIATDAASAAFDNDLAMARIVTGKDNAWLETLKPRSFADIIKTSNELNTDFFAYCLERASRRAETQERMAPGTREMIKDTIRKLAEEKIREAMPGLKALESSAPASVQ